MHLNVELFTSQGGKSDMINTMTCYCFVYILFCLQALVICHEAVGKITWYRNDSNFKLILHFSSLGVIKRILKKKHLHRLQFQFFYETAVQISLSIKNKTQIALKQTHKQAHNNFV